jgi:excisionase family DNA binding protein
MTIQRNTEPSLGELVREAMREALRERLNVRNFELPRLLSVQQAAERLKCTDREIYTMISSRKLASVRHGSRYKIDMRDADEWAERSRRDELSARIR